MRTRIYIHNSENFNTNEIIIIAFASIIKSDTANKYNVVQCKHLAHFGGCECKLLPILIWGQLRLMNCYLIIPAKQRMWH